MKTRHLLLLVFAGAAFAGPPAFVLPAWVTDVGARREPAGAREFAAGKFGAVADGKTVSTAAIQGAIDAAAAAGGGVVTFEPGTYLSGAIFLKSHVHLRVDRGVTLRGVTDEAAYPRRATRVAGIEMEWPAALLNVRDAEDVKISGGGTVDGDGEWGWKKYWTMRRDGYEPRGLRWAADYDCERVRLIVVWRSSDVTLAGLRLRRSGFWTVHVCYSERVTVDGISIRDNGGPSTDGVDIDSSSRVLVQHCDIDNNDDCICLKAGRDFDGLRVNRPTEYVVIRDNVTRRGGGIVSFGSETSGGIRHVVAIGNAGFGTGEGIRFKSARTRGGVVEDVLVADTRMEDVPLPFTFTLNWNPSYSYAALPADTTNLPPNLHGEIPEHWRVMNTPVEPVERGWCEFRDITIVNAQITGARRILTASGMAQRPLRGVRWLNVTASGKEAGTIEHARDWTMRNVSFTTTDGAPLKVTDAEKVALPKVAKAGVP